MLVFLSSVPNLQLSKKASSNPAGLTMAQCCLEILRIAPLSILLENKLPSATAKYTKFWLFVLEQQLPFFLHCKTSPLALFPCVKYNNVTLPWRPLWKPPFQRPLLCFFNGALQHTVPFFTFKAQSALKSLFGENLVMLYLASSCAQSGQIAMHKWMLTCSSTTSPWSQNMAAPQVFQSRCEVNH